MEDLIINFVPTGMIPSKEMTPYVPVTPEEIIEQVHEAYEYGITLTHLHARDENEHPTYKTAYYDKILQGVRHHCPDLVVCLSLSGRSFNELEKRSESLALQPDMGSLTLSSLNFSKQASVNSPEMIKGLLEEMSKYGVKPEMEIFDLGMINYAHYLIKKELIKPPHYFNIIVGNIAGMQAQMDQIATAIHQLPDNNYWALGGIGSQQLDAIGYGVIAGGGVRVGIEDNIYYNKRKTKLATNMELLKRVHELSNIYERSILSPRSFGYLGFYNKIDSTRKDHHD